MDRLPETPLGTLRRLVLAFSCHLENHPPLSAALVAVPDRWFCLEKFKRQAQIVINVFLLLSSLSRFIIKQIRSGFLFSILTNPLTQTHLHREFPFCHSSDPNKDMKLYKSSRVCLDVCPLADKLVSDWLVVSSRVNRMNTSPATVQVRTDHLLSFFLQALFKSNSVNFRYPIS